MDEILSNIRRQGRAVTLGELCENLKRSEQELKPLVDELLESYQLIKVKEDKLALPMQMGVYVGRLQCNPKGFGFLVQEEDDLFIPPDEMNSAMNGDIIVARAMKRRGGRRDGKMEGRVVDVVKRANTQIIGTVVQDKKNLWLIPSDKKLFTPILIDYAGTAKVDDIVSVQVLSYPTKKKPCTGKVVQVIGNKDDSRIDILSAIASFNIPVDFKKQTLKEARQMEEKVTFDPKRTDFRDQLTITIDGDDAKDLDDAVSLQHDGTYYHLTVHIADVSHYVQQGSSLDREAQERGNSVYFPGRVIPMLPKELSNGICSLYEKVDRNVLSCLMTIDENGKVVKSSVQKGVICSNHRMTYKNVNRMFQGDRQLLDEYSDIVEMLERMKELQEILFNDRIKGGSLEFEIPEPEFILDEDGRVQEVREHKRGIAQRMIEEFMLMANQTVCKYMDERNLPCVYRVHELPDEDRLKAFADFVNAYGFKFAKQKVTPKKMQNLLNQVRGTDYESAVSMIMLRSLQKARYATTNYGHFGLGYAHYCHFTSPIRRYADLLVHRILTDSLEGRAAAIKNLSGIADHISETEKNAMDAEHRVNDLYRCYYMEKFVGEEFEGKISGMNGSGIFVQLANTCEGMIRLSSIRGDYFVFQEKLFQIVGERSRRIFRMGDSVKVVVTKVNTELGQVDMELISEG